MGVRPPVRLCRTGPRARGVLGELQRSHPKLAPARKWADKASQGPVGRIFNASGTYGGLTTECLTGYRG